MISALAPERPRRLAAIALASVQLVLALLVVREFHIESQTFFRILSLAAGGFVVHALLPVRFRLPFFAALSIATLPLALGPRDGLFVLVLGLVLIGICHLPVRLVVRVALLVGVGALFAVWRMELLPAPWSAVIWPVLASMFMFRLALYLYTLKYDDAPRSPSRTLAYFFMLPNVCFPLYPVIDYATFARTHYDREETGIYQTGMRWIVRGLIHLILYRFVYLYLTVVPTQLTTLGDLVQFLLATFLLYLRVSGQFHLITGLLHLYGFRLPETHHLYFLAPSFTDFWRRINIYWKDFMMKLVYMPSFFRLRRRGNRTALIGATVLVFLVTWILHSYQWFWLRGGFPLAFQDVLFWGLLGALVVIGSLRETARPRQRTLAPESGWSLSRALRVTATFTVICVLWSLWSADSVTGWLTMWMVAGNPAPGDLWKVAVLAAVGLLFAGKAWAIRETDAPSPAPWYRHPVVHPTAALAGLLVLGIPALYADRSPGLAERVIGLQTSTLNAADAALKHKGYYEKLDNPSRMSAQLWATESQRPPNWVGLAYTKAYRKRNDFFIGDLAPGVRIDFMDKPLTVNRWGMRDRDVALEKPPGTVRIAVLGPSHVMGAGVADGETFSDLLEDLLNRQVPSGSSTRYEVLNFGVAGTAMTHQLMMLHDRARQFRPDVVFVTDETQFAGHIVSHLLEALSRRVPIPFPGLDSLVREVGVEALGDSGVAVPFQVVRRALGGMGIATRMPWAEGERKLRMAADSLAAWTQRQLVHDVREAGAVPVFLGLTNVVDEPPRAARTVREAATAGFLVFDLYGLWEGRDKPALRIHVTDDHPNAAGHRVIANRLFELIQLHRAELRLPAAPADHGNPAP